MKRDMSIDAIMRRAQMRIQAMDSSARIVEFNHTMRNAEVRIKKYADFKCTLIHRKGKE